MRIRWTAVNSDGYGTAEELAAYEAEPQVLAPWDPMGALASK